MTLLRGTAVLADAAARRRAVAGMVAYNLETAQAIVAAAERTGLPVLLQAGASAFAHAGPELARIAIDLAAASRADVGVHLDHSRSLEEVARCLDLGYTSVMFDGSRFSFGENVSLTAVAVQRAHAAGAWAEGELGEVTGLENTSVAAAAGAMTRPDQAAEFVAATGVDVLAVAVGNVHGLTPEPPKLDLGRLGELREAAGVPLVLHGASGLPDDVLGACIDLGVVKFNVNTELRRVWLETLAARLPAAMGPVDLAGPLGEAREAVAAAAARIMRTLAR